MNRILPIRFDQQIARPTLDPVDPRVPPVDYGDKPQRQVLHHI